MLSVEGLRREFTATLKKSRRFLRAVRAKPPGCHLAIVFWKSLLFVSIESRFFVAL